VKFGLWFDFRNPGPWRRPWREIYAETLDLAPWAEEAGFASLWLSEHHLTDDGYLPSLFPMLAALAARTRRIRLGTAVLLAPLHHPLRLAEDSAVVDTLCDGRLDLGLGLGYRQEEFTQLGVPRSERGERTDETVEIIRAAWTGRPFSFHGRHFDFEEVTVTPPPAQRPHPPLWIGGSSQAAARRAGRHGCHFLPDSAAPREVYQAYRAALAKHGHDPAAFRVGVNGYVHVCDDAVAGWDEVGEHYFYAANRYRAWAGERLYSSPRDLPRSRYLVGPPAMVAARIRERRERFPFDQFIFWARPPGMDLARAARSLRRFAAEVMPDIEDS
jgi:probable F420-dependent oxidoreductase